MTYKCNHGRDYEDINQAIECDLRDYMLNYMLKKHTLTAGRATGKNITKWQACLGANGKPLFRAMEKFDKDDVNSMPEDTFAMIMAQSIGEVAYLLAFHPEVMEDMLNEAKATHARLSGFKADDAIKAAAAAGSKHTD